MAVLNARQRRAAVTVALVSIAGFFLYFAHNGLGAYFTGDDVMNLRALHGYFTQPVSAVVLDVFNPITSAYRPMGGVFYRTLYQLFGFNPLPFRYVCFAILLANLMLSYRALSALSRSTTAALLGTLGLAYHAEMSDLYFNTGTIYDILCYTFFLISLIVYIRFRKRMGGLPAVPLIALLVATLFALQSKEMACTIPAVLLLYEACFWPFHLALTDGGLRRLANRLLPALLTALLAASSLACRLLGHNLVSRNPLYQPAFSLAYYLRSCARYQGMLFYSPDLFGIPGLLCLWAAMALLALLLRGRAMAFGLCFWIVTLVPIAVLPPRSGFVLYLPMLGMALYGGVLAARLSAALQHVSARWLRPASRPALTQLTAPALVFGLAMAGLAAAHTSRRTVVQPGLVKLHAESRGVVSAVKRLYPTMERGSQILFVDDPFGADQTFLPFAFQLLYDDAGIRVDSERNRPHARAYTHIFSYRDGNLAELPLRPDPCPPPVSLPGLIDDSSLQLCWQGDWQSGSFPQAIGGTITFTNQAGASVTIAFEGSGLEYIYTRGYNRGIAEMTIDGSSRGTIDLFAPQVNWQASTTFGGLGSGRHVAVVRVLDKRRASAKDSIVDVDAFVPVR
jgi:hypothetical protein